MSKEPKVVTSWLTFYPQHFVYIKEYHHLIFASKMGITLPLLDSSPFKQ